MLFETTRLWTASAAFLACCSLLVGCSGSDYKMAPAQGVVMLDGEPLTGGKVMFAPVATSDTIHAGKPGFANIQSDGSFEVSTYKPGDGAVVAAHRVTIINSDPKSAAGQRIRASRVAMPEQVAVSAGQTNEFTIELTSELINKYGMRF